jgi:hypothetical protein
MWQELGIILCPLIPNPILALLLLGWDAFSFMSYIFRGLGKGVSTWALNWASAECCAIHKGCQIIRICDNEHILCLQNQ